MTNHSIDGAIQSVFGPVVDILEQAVFFAISIGGAEIPLIVVWLLFGGIFLTFWLRIRPIWDARLSFRIIRGQFARHSDPGQITSFQALATELSGTVGLGNIAGVAVAIGYGGPGATLWIIIAGLFGMALKMAETTLSQKFRVIHADGTVSGGPMYYLRDGLASLGRPGFGKVLGIIYAIGMMIASLGAGNVFQANQVAAQVVSVTGGADSPFYGRGWLIGLILAVLAGIVVIGGIKSIARLTSRITPIMALIYIACVVTILITNAGEIPHAISTIFTGAFTGEGVAGGVLGIAVIGIQRAVFSNAAGTGTAGLAHAASKNTRPAEEGFVAVWEPFIDSVVICTMSSLAIVVTGVYKQTDAEGVAMTTDAFRTVNDTFSALLTVCIALFAFSTVLAFAYYGRKAADYVFKHSKVAGLGYDLVYVAFIIIGASVSLDTVVRFSDAMLFVVTVPNLIGIYFLSKVLKEEIVGQRQGVIDGSITPVPVEERSTMLGKEMPQKV